ncbi:MAG: ATP-binding protein [Candidatus Eisenbacteria bacterium]|nr:ATP-binding protein [Candidatus Eisenbacteria bacterium]
MTAPRRSEKTRRRRLERDAGGARNAARAEHLRNEQLIAAMPAALITLDDSETVCQWNALAGRLLGVPASQAIGRPLSFLLAGWDSHWLAHAVTRARSTGETVEESSVPFIRPDGKNGFLDLAVTPMAGGATLGTSLLLVFVETTSKILLQRRLAQAQKLESIGQLAAGIAHEINTPTQFTGDNLQFLRDSVASVAALPPLLLELVEAVDGGAKETAPIVVRLVAACRSCDLAYLAREAPLAIEQSLEGIARVTKIVQSMKEFSHPGSDEKLPVDLNRAIESAVTVSRNEWKYVADLDLDLSADLPPVPVLAGDFNQAILNLIVNAAHAIAARAGDSPPVKGAIRVSTERCGSWAEIRVSDTGTGIPEAIRDRIFDPFFTTKAVGSGTGQGLSIARSVIEEKHHVTIDFETEPGKGTTFVVRLPLEGGSCGLLLEGEGEAEGEGESEGEEKAA